ncbi:maestro heat-like repeat family member 5 isoform X1 [Lutra lutra]|uniref:maestro heat-like repeat family member 5 isoform X1 n=1 Tax=Lutra lutra TaxID=9657 RepID=UPI001FD0E73F|nr:maestro heat-like repeat family member 5 isoform X1 [Lutra lutra]XP_047584222.1 maestro heat-like repeat family member 5 isoform X1 [Lutra lutra]XP_047584224.1 maestro heat-like repeat family member 5 isoform X1 [Lutra lutra]XP_047584225.1 maestro heat-like repeat family member 5 isoform X1 [Lutra lutra]
MVAAPSDDPHCPQWRSSCLSPTEEQEQDNGQPGRAILEEPLKDRLLQEEALVDKIRTMSVLEKNVVLDTIHHCIKEQTQLIWKEVADTGIQELLAPLNLELKQPLEKTFLFHVFGLILRETTDQELVRRHLADLLELSHQSSSQREGIAATIGIASSSHLQAVWALLEHLGRTRFLRTAFMSPECPQPDPDRHWRWVSSTCLLCYGQMALHAPEQILPWVDNIISRMVYYFSCSCYDNILKTSFLSAAIMLTKALRQEDGTQSYKFTQIPDLIQCLLRILQKEPNFLATLFRQKVILVIVKLSSLRPSLKPMVKSQILQTCLQTLFVLPPGEKLKSCLPLLDLAPDVMALYKKSMQALDLLLQSFLSENKSMDEMCFLLQHMQPWLQSDKSHERKRAAQTTFLLLQYTVDYVTLTEEATPSLLGHQLGLLVLLWRDKDLVTRSHSRQSVYLLLQLLIQQKGSTEQFILLNKMKNFEAKARRQSEMKCYNVVKALNRSLTVAQHTQLILTLLERLGSHSRPQCDLASQLLLLLLEDRGVKTEQVAEILQGLFQELSSVVFKGVLQTMMKVVTVLGTQYTQETVEVILSLCHPSERQVLPLWKALAGSSRLARRVLTLLYAKLKLRPAGELLRLSQPEELISLLALGTIYELLYTREYKATVRWAFAGILVGLLTQLRYLFELGAADGISDYEEDVLEVRPLSPCRTCLEALKGLFWTTSYWEVFAHLKLLQGWELFEHLETYTEGVTLLARAMAHYDCEVKAVLGQAVISLKSSEERDNIVAILIITEFLNSQDLTQYVSRRTMDSVLSLGLNHPNQLVRAMSLKGLSSTLMHPKKVVLLRGRLAGLLDRFGKPEPKDLMGLMEILGDILHHLGTQGVGAASLKMAQHLLPLFEDEQAPVRGGAISLFGDVLHSGGMKYRPELKTFAFQALVPLLFHLADPCPDVAMNTKLTFLRCAILLKWEFRKELFGKLAWGHGLGAENDIFIYMVESNFGSYHQFLMQALHYLASPHRNLRRTAMKFIGGLLHDYFTDLCFSLKKGDLNVLRKHVEVLRQDPDSMSRRFYHSVLEDISELSQFVTH